MIVDYILTYHTYLEYNFPILWLYMMLSYTSGVIIYVQNVEVDTLKMKSDE